MENILQYLYAGAWLVACIICIFLGKKIHKILWLVSGMFFFMSAWQITSAVTGIDLFYGTVGWIYRCILAVFLIVGLFWYNSIRNDLHNKFNKNE